MRHLNLKGRFGGGVFSNGHAKLTSASAGSASVEPFPEIQSEQVYSCDKTALYYKLLPNESEKSTQQSRCGNTKGRQTLLLCSSGTV
jgi:hypothetical protein